MTWIYSAHLDTLMLEPGVEFTVPDGTEDVWIKVDETTHALFVRPLTFRIEDWGIRFYPDQFGHRALTAKYHDVLRIKNKGLTDQGMNMCLTTFSDMEVKMDDCLPSLEPGSGFFRSEEFFEIEYLPDDLAEAAETSGGEHLTSHYFQIKSSDPKASGKCMESSPFDWTAEMKPCDTSNEHQLYTFTDEKGKYHGIRTKFGYGALANDADFDFDIGPRDFYVADCSRVGGAETQFVIDNTLR